MRDTYDRFGNPLKNLRDEFAIAALPVVTELVGAALLKDITLKMKLGEKIPPDRLQKLLVITAYEYADTMMSVRLFSRQDLANLGVLNEYLGIQEEGV